MAKSTKKKTIHVVLDTNCLFTEAEDKLISQPLAELIQGTKDNTDLNIVWHLPCTVIAERRYQMLDRAKGLLKPVKKLERLLDHNLNITETIIEERVNAAIKREIEKYNLSQLNLNVSSLCWNALIQCAMNRLPPFEKEKEKGLRDYLILETYWQLSEQTPKSPSSCRIILITSDGLLREAFIARMFGRDNAETFLNLDELKSHINILTSAANEELIKSIFSEVSSLFFQKGSQASLYYAEGVSGKIINNNLVKNWPGLEWRIKVSEMLISLPAFLSKDKQKIKWASKIACKVEAVKENVFSLPGFGNSQYHGLSKEINYLNTPKVGGADFTESLKFLPSTTFTPFLQEEKQKGEHNFEVIWEVTLTKHSKLINPRILKINYLNTQWSDEN